MEEEKVVSREDLNWLIWGDETDQIISKLLDEKSSLNSIINSVLRTSPNLINDHLAIMVVNLESLITTNSLTKEQSQRLLQLDKKYNLNYNYKNRFK
jgi:hypothetical protein